jgi:pyrimidine deaminase RibD-like protein/NTP pyrophosphatase (non-canonical NTP hydrolase)
MDDLDAQAMTLAIDEARKCVPEGQGQTPMVGAVVIKAGQILGAAFRGELAPGDHAEYTLLEKKLRAADLAGATLATTLEPCTDRVEPKIPCADRILARGITRVIVGMMDPNPDITGKGYLRLRAAGCAFDLFPEELMVRVEELNKPFSQHHRLMGLPAAEVRRELSTRTLDAWHIAINKIYWNRNLNAELSYVFAHLVEVVGGLSYLASEKEKPHVDAQAYIQKAVAWWLALCGRAGIRHPSELLWRKFPAVCPYCQRNPHDADLCREAKRRTPGPDWSALADRGAAAARVPGRPSEWLKMFRQIYPVHGDTYGPAFARLSEELGELSEAVRLFDEEPYYFLSEAADVFAWLMRVENIRETKAGTGLDRLGITLDEGLAESYPDFCRDCETRPCRCPPILKRTIGRIAKEVPKQLAGDAAFMSAPDRRGLFGG